MKSKCCPPPCALPAVALGRVAVTSLGKGPSLPKTDGRRGAGGPRAPPAPTQPQTSLGRGKTALGRCARHSTESLGCCEWDAAVPGWRQAGEFLLFPQWKCLVSRGVHCTQCRTRTLGSKWFLWVWEEGKTKSYMRHSTMYCFVLCLRSRPFKHKRVQ